jgi:hypothetical protein
MKKIKSTWSHRLEEPPYGYRWAVATDGNERLEIDPLEGLVVKKIFTLIESDVCLQCITSLLNLVGIPAPEERRVSDEDPDTDMAEPGSVAGRRSEGLCSRAHTFFVQVYTGISSRLREYYYSATRSNLHSIECDECRRGLRSASSNGISLFRCSNIQCPMGLVRSKRPGEAVHSALHVAFRSLNRRGS